MNTCTACGEAFVWDNQVVIVGDTYYHQDCVTLYPTGYVAFIDGEPIGETDNDDGQMAYEIIDGLLEAEEDEDE